MFVWRFCRGWRQFFAIVSVFVVTRFDPFSWRFPHICLSFSNFSMSYRVVRLLTYILRAFSENFSSLSGSGNFFVLRYLVPRSVFGFPSAYLASTRCLWYLSNVRDIFFDFPKFWNFAVIFRYFRCLYRYRVMLSFIYFFVAVFIFVILNAAYHFFYSAVNWLLPRKIFLL